MKAEFKDDALIVIPETPEEIANFQRLFPEVFMRTSKYMAVRQFVDIYGKPEADRPYLLLNGASTAAVVKRTRKPKEARSEEPAHLNA